MEHIMLLVRISEGAASIGFCLLGIELFRSVFIK